MIVARRGWSLAVVLLAAVVVGGCATSELSYRRGQRKTPAPAVANSTAVYSLHREGAERPDWSGVLSAGDRYGFRRNEAGEVVAFTDPYGEIRLADRSAKGYHWRKADK